MEQRSKTICDALAYLNISMDYSIMPNGNFLFHDNREILGNTHTKIDKNGELKYVWEKVVPDYTSIIRREMDMRRTVLFRKKGSKSSGKIRLK